MAKVCEEREVEEARKRYRVAVEEAGRISRKAVSKSFEESREKVFEEFEAFLGSVGCQLVMQARGVGVVAFVQGWWLQAHQGNFRTVVAGQEERVASTSAVKGVISQLAKCYSMLGMRDEENPAKAESVRSYREGYRAELREGGVREKRAKVMPEKNVFELVEYLNKESAESAGIKRCGVAMDRAIVLYLWETWARGKECGSVEARQIDGEKEEVRPGWSKTVHEEPSAVIALQSAGKENSFLWAAGLLMHEYKKNGVEPGDQGYLFCPMNRQKNGFEDCALSAGAMNRRIQRHMQRAGMHEGETVHSFRRSAVQHAAELEGYNVTRLMELGRWKSGLHLRCT